MNLRTLFFFCVSFAVSAARAGNGEIKNFRYQTCDRRTCIIVQSEKGWLSAGSGAFVASGPAKDSVRLQILKDGKLKQEFRGAEVVSQPEIHSMTVESELSVVMVDVNEGSYEIISKSFGPVDGGRK